MKRLFTIITAVLLTATMFAQPPQKMSYQAVIRNSSDQLVTNHAVGMRISILQGSSSGTVVYTETQTPTTNANGLVSIEIGGGAGFDAINWANYTFFIKTETDPTGGINYTITGTSQLLSVPFALHAKTVASYPETDPVFVAHPANGISGSNITNWSTAYGWGNHASAGYVPGTRLLTINGTALDLSANRSWSVGTVTSVGLSMPAIFTVSGSPVTGSGTLSAAFASQSANLVFATPNGSAGTPSFRALTVADIPNLDWSKITTGKPTTLSGYGITDAVNTNGNQTIAGNITFTGTTTVPTPVNATDAATKAYVDRLLSIIQTIQTGVNDVDGNNYKVILIGDQVWMAENLKTTKFKDGTVIPLVTDNKAWSILTTPGYCWYNNDAATYKVTYGALYNWYTVSTGNLCPTGWHVPTDAEWITLTTYLGGESVAGGKLKETGTIHWASPNAGATNETGFTALPGGSRITGEYSSIGRFGNWWSSSGTPSTTWYWSMYCGNTSVHRDGYRSVHDGFSVRCLRD